MSGEFNICHAERCLIEYKALALMAKRQGMTPALRMQTTDGVNVSFTLAIGGHFGEGHSIQMSNIDRWEKGMREFVKNIDYSANQKLKKLQAAKNKAKEALAEASEACEAAENWYSDYSEVGEVYDKYSAGGNA